MISIKDFKKLTLKDKYIFEEFYKKYPPVHSDEIFTTMISWMKYSKYSYIKMKDNIVVMNEINNEIHFRLPIGKKNVELLKDVFCLAVEFGSDKPFVVFDIKSKEWMKKEFSSINFNKSRDYFDYVYKSSDLANLSGSKYSKIRNRLNKFQKNCDYDVEMISEDNMDEVRHFLRRWCLWKDCDKDIVLANEKKAILYSMKHFFDLKLSGIIIRINRRIEAIAVFEKMNSDTAIVHYEKGSPFFDGIYKAINMETAKILQKEFKYINREEDMGIEGLRKAKMSYRPHHMVEVNYIKKEDLKLICK